MVADGSRKLSNKHKEEGRQGVRWVGHVPHGLKCASVCTEDWQRPAWTRACPRAKWTQASSGPPEKDMEVSHEQGHLPKGKVMVEI